VPGEAAAAAARL